MRLRLCAVAAVVIAVVAGCGSNAAGPTTTAAGATTGAATTTTTKASTSTSAPSTTSTSRAATTTSTSATSGSAGPTSKEGKVGDLLETEGLDGKFAIKILEVIDPSTDLLTGAHYRIDAGRRTVTVRSEITNRSAKERTSPDLYLVLVDDRDEEFTHSIAIVDACPSHEAIAPGATGTGCTHFELSDKTPVKKVRWNPGLDPDDAVTFTI
jgi:hypothetical protein